MRSSLHSMSDLVMQGLDSYSLNPYAQARAVVDGLPGDIVALALPLDIMKIAESGLIDDDWQARRQC